MSLALICWLSGKPEERGVGGEILGECVSFPLETPLTVHRLNAERFTTAWAVYKAGICDWGRR